MHLAVGGVVVTLDLVLHSFDLVAPLALSVDLSTSLSILPSSTFFVISIQHVHLVITPLNLLVATHCPSWALSVQCLIVQRSYGHCG
jgi:hypothetical protein